MVYGLKCNGTDYPISVDRRAVITWQTDCGQTHFEIAFFVNGNKIYESGKVKSALPIFAYNEKFFPLSDYTYAVTAYCGDGVFTSEGKFRTALTNGFPEKCKWIGLNEKFKTEPSVQGNPATVLYKEFTVAEVSDLYIHMAGLGLSVLNINGCNANEAVLDAEFTNCNKSVLYKTVNVRKYLKNGTNRISITLGDGWYNQIAPDEWNFYKADWKGVHKTIVYGEGCAEIFSDGSWQAGVSGVIKSSQIRLGERWDFTSDDLTCNDNAVIVNPPDGILKSRDFFPIKETEYIEYVSAHKYNGGIILDFGKNITGYLNIKIEQLYGRIKIRYGDRLLGGRIDNVSNGQYVYGGEYQTDGFVSDGEVDFKPEFTYHGFRWVEIEGLEEIPQKHEIKAVFIRSSFPKTSCFECSDNQLNTLFNGAVRSLECNFTGFPTDCPQREKNGWTGDMQLSADAYMLNFACFPNLYKWLEDIEDAQLASGKIPCIIPSSGWGYDWGCGPAWDYALFALPVKMYRYGGDSYVLSRFFQTMEKYFSYLLDRQENFLFEVGLGDWNYPKNIAVEVAPTRLTDSCYAYAMAQDLQKISCVLGDFSKADKYLCIAEKIKEAIRKKYLFKLLNSQTAVAAMLYFKLLQPDEISVYVNALTELIEISGFKYNSGILGVKFINNVLCENGRVDLFVKLMRQSDYPSFGYWFKRGATALWEDWEGTNSRNHHMYADISACMLKYVLGVNYSAESGNANLVIMPYLRDIGHICGKVEIPGGEVSVEITEAENAWNVKIILKGLNSAEFKYGNETVPINCGENKFTVGKIN